MVEFVLARKKVKDEAPGMCRLRGGPDFYDMPRPKEEPLSDDQDEWARR